MQGLFIFAVVMAFLFILSPLISRVDIALKRTREMLLFFPDDVVMGVAAIKKLMQDYARTRLSA